MMTECLGDVCSLLGHASNIGKDLLASCIAACYAQNKSGKPKDNAFGGVWPSQPHGHVHYLSSDTAKYLMMSARRNHRLRGAKLSRMSLPICQTQDKDKLVEYNDVPCQHIPFMKH